MHPRAWLMTIAPLSESKTQSLYEADYFAWIETNLQRLKDKDYSSVDWENLIEEIADIGRSEKRGLRSDLTVVLRHLLKWQYQLEHRSRSWMASIVEHRIRVAQALEESPSLKPYVEKDLATAYRHAVKVAIAETGLPDKTFPAECPYAIAQVLNEDFIPE